ncbi:MAG: GNAT family N-acetyltransferase [Clostridia bacterium]|nr:GNAT family N-acetyltransferase [Clostridia bacterium]
MILETAKMNEIGELTKISKAAFESDIKVGAKIAGGPPEYDNVNWHIQMLKSGHLLSAVENEVIVGGAVIFINDKNELFIGRIFIDPKYQRKGYGIELMEKIEERYKNCNTIWLDTPTWNRRTNSFYPKLGYKQIKIDNESVYYKKELNCPSNL